MLREDAAVKKALSRHQVSSGEPGDLRMASPFHQRCPTRLVLDRIADKWSVLILVRLREGPTRFNQIRREVEGLTQKMLSQTLKAMERDGLVSRKAMATVPVTVEYALTPLGATLVDTVDALQRWASENIADVLAAQARYDTAAGA